MTIDQIIQQALIEDVGNGDHTSLATIPEDIQGRAKLVFKQDGILAGVDVAEKVFKTVDKNTGFRAYKKDGDRIVTGEVGFVVEGKKISLLTAERLALNFLQRMSGIATFTNSLVDKLNGLNTKLLDTRKTTPLMRELEKHAVKMGGGFNHRMGLYDMIMIKDNHVDFAGGIKNAIEKTKMYLQNNNLDLKIEIEVRNFHELEEVMHNGGIDRIMLDNFTVSDMKKAVEIIDKQFETEASGGITEINIRDYAETGVDYISVGALTHQIRSLDMSLLALS
ncbi:MAG: carboxylating nicotinate-nucleotide diphosphorylase [Bacteroidales bacterium]|nr:carboxylating nicotinate-nucleotide diphosphorylase [Bacteroidales bacterium]MCF8402901.1 carboxylating nicotinate-nucleotide diphosphorylase [Bacteroidales bacterium]